MWAELRSLAGMLHAQLLANDKIVPTMALASETDLRATAWAADHGEAPTVSELQRGTALQVADQGRKPTRREQFHQAQWRLARR